MIKRLLMVTLLTGLSAPARSEVIVACSFPTLPSAVMRFPHEIDAEKTLQIGGRPAVRLVEGGGEGRLMTGSVDGYEFRFASSNSVMDVDKDGTRILSEVGQCITIGGPTNDAPLVLTELGAPDAAQTDEGQPADTQVGTAESTGSWKVSEEKSAFDDSSTVVLSLESTEHVRGQFGPPGPVVMYLRCMENTTSIYFWVNDLFLADFQGYGTIDYRLDDQKAATIKSSASTDNKALGLWSGGSAIPFATKLLGAKRGMFRLTPMNESPVEFSFDLTGIENAILPLREACSW